MVISRTDATRFHVVTPNGVSDTDCRLDGNRLCSFEQRGHIRVGGLVKITLGPKSLARVQAMNIGDVETFSA